MLPEQNDPLNSQFYSSNLSKKLQVVTISLLISSVVLNVMLANKTRRLGALLLTFKAKVLAVKAEQSLVPGALLPPIEARDLDGHPKLVEYNSGDLPTVLYVFTPPCSWCAKNVSNLKTLAEKTKGRYRVIGLSLSANNLREYMNKYGFEFPVYTDLSPKVVLSYRLGGTPQTLLVSDDGKLVREWKGAYMGPTKKEIENYFGLELPGVNDQEPK